MNERTELLIERSKPGKFALRMRNKETGDSVVVSEGRTATYSPPILPRGRTRPQPDLVPVKTGPQK